MQCVETEAVGSTLCLQVSVEGVPVDAAVETGSQSTIISCSMLHSIAHKQKEGGLPPPTLELPTARLFGKDSHRGGCELVITTQLKVTIEVDGLLANVIAFVQPDSELQCLLGMNALPALGLTVRRANGENLILMKGNDTVKCITSCVNLVQYVLYGVLEANVKADSVQLVKEECMHDSTVSGVSVQESCEKGMEELLNALNLPAEKMTEHQYQLLVALVKNYSDVFALTDKELGCTSTRYQYWATCNRHKRSLPH